MKRKFRFNLNIIKSLTEFFIIDKSETKEEKLWDNFYSEFAVMCGIAIFMASILWSSDTYLCTYLIPQDDVIYNAIYNEPPSITRIDENSIININTASKAELLQLYGIGNKLSERILNYRFEKGRFDTIYDIRNVDGLSQATFEKIKHRITV